ncbi:hypothetical protein PC41400_06290 [Paenibacillus chitinolyticus]|uniref:Uncharacterized protein n=1 Tax=Paenibacillus chitinolyticus TaxID=79263 RepID=A0A410WSF8_9BACL|nr:hypothetical protein [Paenibacillus chitinolyticus]MCY9591293.1 hypothetical protein [Paenibacillus chitinolyticus]MCY9595524.1 hypothetical protein [Paenibacillus chitinolyticus]QAV17293.1 hypothetical protein PC41400_06290 [Paenibacillus chitinolyticus]
MTLNEKIAAYVELMNEAREISNRANSRAYELRQTAVRIGFEATAAAEHAALMAEIVRENTESGSLSKLIHASREAASRAAEATLKALDAIKQANVADHEATEAFERTREAAEKLTEALQVEGY